MSVVALGYHWPSDALAGWGIGVLMAYAGRVLVVNRFRTPGHRSPAPAGTHPPAETSGQSR